MIVLIQDKRPAISDPPHLAEAIEVLRNLYGRDIYFDLQIRPHQAPVLMAYRSRDGVEELIGPVR